MTATIENLEEAFLRFNAGRHFVALTYRLTRGAERLEDHISCFLVDLDGVWFLLTAGHWLEDPETGLKHLLKLGYRIDKTQLVDAFAGHDGSPLPIDFDLAEWIVVYDEDQGIDLAAVPLHPFHCRGLESVGIAPIEPHAISTAQFEKDTQLVLAGVPAEGVRREGVTTHMRFMLIPIYAYEGGPLPERGGSLLGTMAQNPSEQPHRVDDIKGMSGCPVFSISNQDDTTKRYRLVGMQSSWYERSRVIRFCPVDVFIKALRKAVQQFNAS